MAFDMAIKHIPTREAPVTYTALERFRASVCMKEG
jgi:hypothetical protein